MSMKNQHVRAKIDYLTNALPDSQTTPVNFIYADGGNHVYGDASKSSYWSSGSLPLEGLIALTALPHDYCKEHSGLSLCTLKNGQTTRGMDNVESWTGIGFDDDNHKSLGRDKIITTAGPFRICYGTASDGKSRDSIPLSALVGCGLHNATDDDIQRFLNLQKDGEPYRNVRAVRTLSGLLKVRPKGDDYIVDVTMQPHVRTRSLVIYKNPIAGELLDALRAKSLFPAVCKAMELDIYGICGHDVKTFRPNAVAFLPAKNHTEFFHTTCGSSQLYDPIPIAEQVLADASRPEKTFYTAKTSKSPDKTTTTRSKRGRLYGLRLATLISERFPALRYGNTVSPIRLRRCPFANEHSTRRGQEDRSTFVYDASPERSGYPYIGCHHTTCKKRESQEFLARMIADGDLTEEALHDKDYLIELE